MRTIFNFGSIQAPIVRRLTAVRAHQAWALLGLPQDSVGYRVRRHGRRGAPRLRQHRLVLALVVGLSAALLAACERTLPKTAVLVVVDSDLSVGDELSSIAVSAVDPENDRELASATFVLSERGGSGGHELPLSLAIAAKSQSSRELVRIVVTGRAASVSSAAEIPVVEQRADVQFVPNKLVRLDVSLARTCVQQFCVVGDRPQSCDALTGHCGKIPLYDDLPEARGDGIDDFVWAAGVADRGVDSDGGIDGGDTGTSEPDANSGDTGRSDGDEPDAASRERVCDSDFESSCTAEARFCVNTESGSKCEGCLLGFAEDPGGKDTSCRPVLESLATSVGPLSPQFDPLVTEYSVEAGKWDASIKVAAIGASGHSVTVAGEETVADSMPQLELQHGENKFLVVASVEGRSRTYTLSVTRPSLHLEYVSHPLAEGGFLGARIALSGDGNTLAASAPANYGCGTGVSGLNRDPQGCPYSGAVYVYGWSQGEWKEQAFIKPEIPALSYNFGHGLALSSNEQLLVAGFQEADQDILIDSFRFEAAQGWRQAQPVDRSFSVSAAGYNTVATNGDGSVVVIGHPDDASCYLNTPLDEGCPRAGSVYVLTWSGSRWTQQGYLKAWGRAHTVEPTEGAQFGASVAISTNGKVLAVGAPGSNHGEVYVFDRSDSSWELRSWHAASEGEDFGQSLALNANGSVVASGGKNRVGVMTPRGSGLDVTYFGRFENGFGDSVALDATGDILAAGGGGAALVFKKTGDSWHASGERVIPTSLESLYWNGNTFGSAISLSRDGSRVAVGSPQDRGCPGFQPTLETCTQSGGIYVYD